MPLVIETTFFCFDPATCSAKASVSFSGAMLFTCRVFSQDSVSVSPKVSYPVSMPALFSSTSIAVPLSALASACTCFSSVTSSDLDADVAFERIEAVGILRIARGGDDRPAVAGILLGELEADAAVGAGDEDGRT